MYNVDIYVKVRRFARSLFTIPRSPVIEFSVANIADAWELADVEVSRSGCRYGC